MESKNWFYLLYASGKRHQFIAAINHPNGTKYRKPTLKCASAVSIITRRGPADDGTPITEYKLRILLICASAPPGPYLLP